MAKRKVSPPKPKRQATRAKRKTPEIQPDLMDRFAKLLGADRADLQDDALYVALVKGDKSMNDLRGFADRTWSAGNALAAALTGNAETENFHGDALRMLAVEARVMAAAIQDIGYNRQERVCDRVDLLYFAQGMAGRAKAAEQMGRRYNRAQRILAAAQQAQGGK